MQFGRQNSGSETPADLRASRWPFFFPFSFFFSPFSLRSRFSSGNNFTQAPVVESVAYGRRRRAQPSQAELRGIPRSAHLPSGAREGTRSERWDPDISPRAVRCWQSTQPARLNLKSVSLVPNVKINIFKCC